MKMKPKATGHLLLRSSNIQLKSSKPNVGTMNMQTINHMSSMITPMIYMKYLTPRTSTKHLELLSVKW